MVAGPDTITDEAGDAHTHDRLHHERSAQQGLRKDGIGEPAVDRSGLVFHTSSLEAVLANAEGLE